MQKLVLDALKFRYNKEKKEAETVINWYAINWDEESLDIIDEALSRWISADDKIVALYEITEDLNGLTKFILGESDDKQMDMFT
jgi:phage head maturation protease